MLVANISIIILLYHENFSYVVFCISGHSRCFSQYLEVTLNPSTLRIWFPTHTTPLIFSKGFPFRTVSSSWKNFFFIKLNMCWYNLRIFLENLSMHIFTTSKFRKSCEQFYSCLQMASFRRNFKFPKHHTFVETVLKLTGLLRFYLNPLYFRYTYLVLDSIK